MGARNKGESACQREGKWNQEDKGGQKAQRVWPEMRDKVTAARPGRSACASLQSFFKKRKLLYAMSSGEESQLQPHI